MSMRVFVSCQSIDGKSANNLICGLRMAGVEVEHSPRNPLDGEDSRWETWYQDGLQKAIENCDIFVIVVDQGWDSSSWMGTEADAGFAVTRGRSPLRTFFWNPESIIVKAVGMTRYLRHELPKRFEDAILRIASETE